MQTSNKLKMKKNKLINSIDSTIIEKKSELSERRVLKVSSSLLKLTLEVINGEFVETCIDFSVVDCGMSPDLRYLDIFIRTPLIDNKEDQLKFLKTLNYDDLPQHKRILSKFYKISLKHFIVRKIVTRMRLRIVPIVRFKIYDDSLEFVSR